MLSQIADRALSIACCGSWQSLTVQWTERNNRFEVWLPESKGFDAPDGFGNTVAEALEDAAHKVVNRER